MSDDVLPFVEAFGRAVVAKDHEALDVQLAPWIRVADCLEQFRASFDSMLHEWGAPAGSWPARSEADRGVLTYENLREPSDFPPGIDIPEQVTADNYVGWYTLTFLAPEDDDELEFDAYCDAWFAIVKLPDGYHVGSLEIVDPD